MNDALRVLSELSDGLLVAVVLVLLLLSAATLFGGGRFLREAWERFRIRSLRARWMEGVESRRAAERALGAIAAETRAPEFLARFARRTAEFIVGPKSGDHRIESLKIDRVMVELEHGMTGRIRRIAALVRIGPMLGLMGTLIPMGPALRGLATGNLAALTNNLVVAFATTVLGLAIGAVASLLTTARTHWYAADLSDIEYLAEWLSLSNAAEASQGEHDDRTEVTSETSLRPVTRRATSTG